MNPWEPITLAHLGILVSDMTAMTTFYVDALGFRLIDRCEINGKTLTFLSLDPQEHHQVAFVPGRELGSPSSLHHVSFRVASLEALKRVYNHLAEVGLGAVTPINHGSSWAIYFYDPEGNQIEMSARTPWYTSPVSVPLDLTLSDEAISSLTERMVFSAPLHKLRSEWEVQMRQRFEETDPGTHDSKRPKTI